MTTIHVLSHEHLTPAMTLKHHFYFIYKIYCHTAIENLSDPIGYLLDFTNPYYTALAGNMKARAKKDNSIHVLSHEHLTPAMTLL
jgi:hypothetical protein